MKIQPKKAFEASLFTYAIVFSSTPTFTSENIKPVSANYCYDRSNTSCQTSTASVI